MMRVGIIGSGGAGAMAAWRCAQEGHDVVLFEQFTLDHDLGSSYGDSRIVRRVYADPFYTELMARAYELWDELQAASPDRELFTPCGGVFAGPPAHPELLAACDALSASGVPFETLGEVACRDRFPAFRLKPGEIALYEPSMGYVRASHCVHAAVWLAQEQGASLRQQTPVRNIAQSDSGTGVRIVLASGEIVSFDRAIVCSGAWSKPLLASLGCLLPLTITRQTYAHFPVPENGDYAPCRFPVWIDAATYDYGFPRLGDCPGVKVATHRQGQVVTPGSVGRTVSSAELASLALAMHSRARKVGPLALLSKVCLYSNTPDEDFIIDTLPGMPDALVISACSGHGFKFTPLLGQIAADFATTGVLSSGLGRFSFARF